MASEGNRSIVEKYICHKLSKRGLERRLQRGAEGAANNGSVAATPDTLVRRCRTDSTGTGTSTGPDGGGGGGDIPPRRCTTRPPDALAAAAAAAHRVHRADRVLREAGDELERLYRPDFTEMSRQLQLTSAAAQRRFAEVIDELFRDGVNWGRIIAFFEFGGTVCAECAEREETAPQVDDIAEWMTEYLDGPLSGWMRDNGGWDAFVDLYDRQRDSLFSCSWPSIRTVFGLAALGAASLTIGAYLTQK